MERRIIDIHSHILFGVDDGSVSLKMSKAMLKDAAEQGICRIIATPHYRQEMFDYPAKKIMENFKVLKEEAATLGIELRLGCEYFVDNEIIENIERKRVATLAGSRYVLTEYSSSAHFSMIKGFCHTLLRQGYIPVIAHIERIGKLAHHIEYVRELSDMGVMLQVNASGMLGEDGFMKKQTIKKWLKEGLVDVVASDGHNMKKRPIYMEDASIYLEKVMGPEVRDALLYYNPLKIFEEN